MYAMYAINDNKIYSLDIFKLQMFSSVTLKYCLVMSKHQLF